MFKHKNMSRNLKIIGGILFVVIIGISFSGCFKSKYVKYDDIDDIEYAEPTEYAKNFDLEGYINKLPEVEYEKVDYPVKETYTYKFNDYEMTIDIPEGFEVYEKPLSKALKRNTRVINSVDIESSRGDFSFSGGPSNGEWRSSARSSHESILCIDNINNQNNNEKQCKGIVINPSKSMFKGISYKDIFVRTLRQYAARQKTKYHVFLTIPPYNTPQIVNVAFLDDDQGVRISLRFSWDSKSRWYFQEKHESYNTKIDNSYSELQADRENYFFSIMDSIKITKIK
jgi:hypothetical protein